MYVVVSFLVSVMYKLCLKPIICNTNVINAETF